MFNNYCSINSLILPVNNSKINKYTQTLPLLFRRRKYSSNNSSDQSFLDTREYLSLFSIRSDKKGFPETLPTIIWNIIFREGPLNGSAICISEVVISRKS